LRVHIAQASTSAKGPEESLLKAIEDEEIIDRKWAKTKKAAETLLMGKDEPKLPITATSLKDYMVARGYGPALSDESAVRTLSSVRTFPLSLAYAYRHLNQFSRPKVNFLIIGARGEATLPSMWWKECIYAGAGHINEVSIKMIGPSVRPKSTTGSTERLEWSSFTADDAGQPLTPFVNIDIPGNAPSLLHDAHDMFELLQWADIFVLFNPGLASAAHASHWGDTMRILLETRKPILCTAHGEQDALADLKYLDSISIEEDHQEIGEPLEFLIPPHENPFRTLRRTVDRREEKDGGPIIVTTNHYLYAFTAK
jgi:hypothetical protein